MIKGMKVDASTKTFEGVISFLQSLPENFYLTGSRFFGNETDRSDYDFFTSVSNKNLKILKEFGFQLISCEKMDDLSYDRSQFSEILEIVVENITIQIQFVSNIHAKILVQDMIKRDHILFFNSLSKEQRKNVWSMLLKAGNIVA